MKEIYTAVNEKQDEIIDFEQIKNIKKKTAKKVEGIIDKNKRLENIKISLKELQYYICDDCFTTLLGMLDEFEK